VKTRSTRRIARRPRRGRQRPRDTHGRCGKTEPESIASLRIQGEYDVVVDLLRDGFSYFAQRVPTYRSAEQLAAHEQELLERDGWRNLGA
jgi:hypothetical protein